MGQYYKFANIDKKEKCDRNRSGYKLMEHSYVGNGYCDDILRLLSNEWKGDRVIHAGDYAEPNDETTTQNVVEKLSNEENNDFLELVHYMAKNGKEDVLYKENELFNSKVKNYKYFNTQVEDTFLETLLHFKSIYGQVKV